MVVIIGLAIKIKVGLATKPAVIELVIKIKAGRPIKIEQAIKPVLTKAG